MKAKIYNAVAFNLAWLVCVLGGSVIAVPVSVLVIVIHLKFFSGNLRELYFIIAVLLFGVVVDSGLIRSGLLIAPDNSLWPPLWLMSLWALFATTLNHSLKWFQTHLPSAILVGGVAGALTYLAGTRLTGFALKSPQLLTLLLMFLVWCVVFPICLLVARKALSTTDAVM